MHASCAVERTGAEYSFDTAVGAWLADPPAKIKKHSFSQQHENAKDGSRKLG